MAKKPLIDSGVDLAGKLAVVTGSNTGIGLVTARALARSGARVIMACRSEQKAEQAMDAIRVECPAAQLEFLPLDLSSLDSARGAAETLCKGARIDVLINNAGLAGARGETREGFELAFGVNHLGHFAFTEGVRPHLQDGGRVVVVASKAHYQAKAMDWEAFTKPTATRTGLREYNVSKLANVLFARRLAAELAPRGINTYALHPGVVASDIWRKVPWGLRWLVKLFMISNEDGARTSLHCATSPAAAASSGAYWDLCKERKPSALARDDALRDELWQRSVEWAGR